MCVEALLCLMPKVASEVHAPMPHCVDRDPRAHAGMCTRPLDGLVKLLDDEFSSAMGRFGLCKDAVDDGPCFLFDPYRPGPELAGFSWAQHEHTDQQSPLRGLSTPDDGLSAASSQPSSLPVSGHVDDFVDGAMVAAANGTVVPVAEQLSAEEFVAAFTKPLEEPLLPTPSLRRTKPSRQDEQDWLPKRSALRPDAQAQKLLMKKLGYEVDTLRPDEASFDEFHNVAFQAALCGQAGEAMQCLF